MEHKNLDFIKKLIDTEYNSENDYSVTIDESDPSEPRLFLYTLGEENQMIEAEFQLYGGEEISGIFLVCSLFSYDGEKENRYAIKYDLLQDALVIVNNVNYELKHMIGRLLLGIVENEYLVPRSVAYFRLPAEPSPETLRPVIKDIMENNVIYELAASLSILIDVIEETYKQPWVSFEDEDTISKSMSD